MKTWAVVLLVILAILIVAVVVVYFLGRKMQSATRRFSTWFL